MFEIYAYGNVDTLTGVFNAIAAIMGGADYFGLIRSIALLGVLVAACAGLFSPGRFHGWSWLIGFLLVYYALFLPKSTVVIVDKLGGQSAEAIDNVPIGVAFFGHATSQVGDVLTRFFETAFQTIPAGDAQLPAELTYQKNGVMFANRLVQASRAAQVADPQLRADLIGYVQNCTVYDLQDGTIDPATFARSTDIWSLMGNPNPARFAAFGSPVQVDTCPNAYARLASRLPDAVAEARARLAFQMNPNLDPSGAIGAIDPQLEQAYLKTRIANAAQGAADLLRQNILINLIQDSQNLSAQQRNDPTALMLATARANATAATNSSFQSMGKIAEQALPLVRNVIEAVIYAVFPFVFLLFLLAQGQGLALAIKGFVMSLAWIQLWPPLYAILNYVATLASARHLEAAARMGSTAQGLALETAAGIYQGAISDQAIAGYLVISIPVIASAILKGADVAFQSLSATGPIQSAASSEGAASAKGQVSQASVQFDQQQLAPTRTSAFMANQTDAAGTTTQGLGPDAGILRYQANLSRLATTFTFGERQASQLADSAREAETHARSEREALSRSQASTLTHALGIQDSYDRSQQRTGQHSNSDSGSTTTQLQTLNTIAQDVNRKLGLREESGVGKTITAAASMGIKIPLTEIGATARKEGRELDQETLQSSYDYARSASERAQLSVSNTLTKDFQSSQAYQWARNQRSGGTEGYDNSARESTEHQTSHDNALTRAQELARTAQFMREWSQGAQTDFTTYAAQRLAERGLLRESDPVKLQSAVIDIAQAYANGGSSPTGAHVPQDSPLRPSPTPSNALHWTQTPAEAYQAGRTPDPSTAVNDATAQSESSIRKRQQTQHVKPRQNITNDVKQPAHNREATATKAIETGQREIGQDAGRQTEDYRRNVRRDKIHPDHGGNKAVWDTVGANSTTPAFGVSSQAPVQNGDSGGPEDIPKPAVVGDRQGAGMNAQGKK